MQWLALALRLLGIGFLLHALMLVGADEITSFENGYIRTIRPLGHILALYGADPAPLLMAVPAWASIALAVVFRARD